MSAVPMDRPHLAGRETTLYRCWNELGDLLYVGVTSDLTARMKQHKYSTPWYSQVARITAALHPDRMSALVAEAKAIETEGPIHNAAPRFVTSLPPIEWTDSPLPPAPTGEATDA